MSFVVYVLQSGTDHKYYIGSTGNLERRLNEHHKGRVRSTKNRRPLSLVYTENCDNEQSARLREKQIKKYKGGEAFKKLLSS